MALFSYKAKLSNGTVVSGMIEAADKREASEKLRLQKMAIVELAEKTEDLLARVKDLLPGFGKPAVRSKDLVLFSRQLSTLVSAGVPIVQSLGILERQSSNPAFREVLVKVKTDIEAEKSISEALGKHPKAFPSIYSAMIRAGELGGILDTILERLSRFLEASEELKGKVKSALTYPAIVLLICVLVVVFLMVFVIPTFKTVFEGFGADLPPPTRAVLALSDFARGYWYVLLGLPAAAAYFFRRWYETPAGRSWVDARLLRVPGFGILLMKVAVAKFARTLGTLVKAGVPILQALEAVAATAGNAAIEQAVLTSRRSVSEGGRLAAPLVQSGVFPEMVTQMISVGEETGALDQMLEKIADFYDSEVDAAVKGLTSMIEPLVIVFMGVVVGAIAVAMFLPIVDVTKHIE
jgi:type IV pilus assembly protein PilC